MTFLKRHIYLSEVLLWIIGIGLLAAMNPVGDHLFSFCPFSWLFDNLCPGCGLGHAIAFLFRGEIVASVAAHPLGIPVVAMLSWRCGKLMHWHFNMSYT